MEMRYLDLRVAQLRPNRPVGHCSQNVLTHLPPLHWLSFTQSPVGATEKRYSLIS